MGIRLGRSPRIIVASLLVAFASAAVPADSVAAQTETAEVFINGLPDGIVPDVYLVEPVAGGGFLRRSLVGSTQRAAVRVPPGWSIEAVPIFISDTEAFVAAKRFQLPAARVAFNYEDRVHVTISTWSRGGPLDEHPGGEVSESSQWVKRGSRLTVAARPRSEWRLAHWGVFEQKERASSERVSYTTATISLVADRPTHVVVGFTRP